MRFLFVVAGVALVVATSAACRRHKPADTVDPQRVEFERGDGGAPPAPAPSIAPSPNDIRI